VVAALVLMAIVWMVVLWRWLRPSTTPALALVANKARRS
jgi:hypothetical protein